MTDYLNEYQEIVNRNKNLFSQCAEVGDAFKNLHKKACASKTLDAKQKELIALGIAIAIRCEGCIISHVSACVREGATLDEISDTIEIAIMMGGGPSVMYAGKAFECAQQFLNK